VRRQAIAEGGEPAARRGRRALVDSVSAVAYAGRQHASWSPRRARPGGASGHQSAGPGAARRRRAAAAAGVRQHRFTPQVTEGPERESHNLGRLPTLVKFGGSIAVSTVGRGLSQLFSGAPKTAYKVGDPRPARGIYGEGADHAEFGDYTLPVGSSMPGNIDQENHYITESLKSLDQGAVDDALNRLRDAAHVSADRGSHGEGAKGKGHDTPYPPPGREGTTLMPYYMDGWEDNDDRGKNGDGYRYGVTKTADMFSRFVAAAGNRGEPALVPTQGYQGGDQGGNQGGHQGGDQG
jgi:hypothetical protein